MDSEQCPVEHHGPGWVENSLLIKGIFPLVLKASSSPPALPTEAWRPCPLQAPWEFLSGPAQVLREKDQGELVLEPQISWGKKWAATPQIGLNVSCQPLPPSRPGELHFLPQNGVWILTHFPHSRSLYFAPLRSPASVSPSVTKGWPKPGGRCGD